MATTLPRRETLRRRMLLQRLAREALEGLGYDEVETPILVRTPGMEPPIQAFRTDFVPELGRVAARPLWLHTSPEYAMKRLLADGWQRIFQLARVFRNGEVSDRHNPEFTMLEAYRAGADCHALMDDVETLFRACAAGLRLPASFPWQQRRVDLTAPFERVSVRDAMLRATGLDIFLLTESAALRDAARAKGHSVPDSATSWDDVFFSVFVVAVEPHLGVDRPTFLIEYPARMASLARLKPDDPRVAERFELYVHGLELANGFSELTDAAEQRRRLLAEQDERRAAGREVYPIDDVFLEAVGRLPPSAGVAIGFDRLAMLLCDVPSISDVLLFPAAEEWA